MMTGSFFNAAISVASATVLAPLPTSGPLPPACDVEKKTGSTWSKSFSSRILCTRTDPTMPRQPTMPTLNMTAFPLQPFRDRGCHLRGAYLPRTRSIYVRRAETVAQRLLHRTLQAFGRGTLVERVAQHQRRRQDRRQRIGDALARDVGRGTVDRLVQALAVRIERRRGQHADRAR